MSFVDADKQIYDCVRGVMSFASLNKSESDLLLECKDYALLKHANLASYPILEAEIMSSIFKVKKDIVLTAGLVENISNYLKNFFSDDKEEVKDQISRAIASEITANPGLTSDDLSSKLDSLLSAWSDQLSGVNVAELKEGLLRRHNPGASGWTEVDRSAWPIINQLSDRIEKLYPIVEYLIKVSVPSEKDKNSAIAAQTEYSALRELVDYLESVKSRLSDRSINSYNYTIDRLNNLTDLMGRLERINPSQVASPESVSAPSPAAPAEESKGSEVSGSSEDGQWSIKSDEEDPYKFKLDNHILSKLLDVEDEIIHTAESLKTDVPKFFHVIGPDTKNKLKEAAKLLSDKNPANVIRAAAYIVSVCQSAVTLGFRGGNSKDAAAFVKDLRKYFVSTLAALDILKNPATSAPTVATPKSAPAPIMEKSKETNSVISDYFNNPKFKDIRKTTDKSPIADVYKEVRDALPGQSPEMQDALAAILSEINKEHPYSAAEVFKAAPEGLKAVPAPVSEDVKTKEVVKPSARKRVDELITALSSGKEFSSDSEIGSKLKEQGVTYADISSMSAALKKILVILVNTAKDKSIAAAIDQARLAGITSDSPNKDVRTIAAVLAAVKGKELAKEAK